MSGSHKSFNRRDFCVASSWTSKRVGEIQSGKIFRLTHIFPNWLLTNVHSSNTNSVIVLRSCATAQQLIAGFLLLRPRSTSGQSVWESEWGENDTVSEYSDTSANEDNSFRNHIR